MGDVISTHLDENRRQFITERTGKILDEFFQFYEEQYPLALFNKIRYEVEENGGPQPQLLQRKAPLKDRVIFSGNLYQYMEVNRKWKNRYFVVRDDYDVAFYDGKMAYDRGASPKGVINCAGYKVLKSMDRYLELINNSMPGIKGKASNSPFLKWPTEYRTILWHPYEQHYYFCVISEKEQQKWHAVFQDCVRHLNNGLPEDCKVETPAFTDAVRLYRQSKDQYGTWDMLCGNQAQIISNLVMEELLPELGTAIQPKLKGKFHDRQRAWILITEAVHKMVLAQTKARYEAVLRKCEEARPGLESRIRPDMDQIISSKEHVGNKIRVYVMPKAEACVRNQVQPYISSILDALMGPTSRGFAEVRDLFFKEIVEMNKNVLNEGGQHKLGEYMEKLSVLPYHPVKMQSCYEHLEQLQPQLEGLQQRFDLSSPAVFVQRGQILMRELLDNAVYTFEQLLHQDLGHSPDKEQLCKTIQRIQDRVLKKYDYDSSTVRKKFFREALLQITIPYMLKKLSSSVNTALPKFQEYIFEDFSKFILVDNIFEEVVLQSVSKDIMLAVKEAAVQRKHNLFRDSIVLSNSDPNLLLLEEQPINWNNEFGSQESGSPADASDKRKRMKQVVSMIQDDGVSHPEEVEVMDDLKEVSDEEQVTNDDSESCSPVKSPDSVKEIRDLLTIAKIETTQVPAPTESSLSNGVVCKNANVAERNPSEEISPKLLQEQQQATVQSSGGESGLQSSPEKTEAGCSSTVGCPEKALHEEKESLPGKVTLCQEDSNDKETGEEISSKITEAAEDSHEAHKVQETESES
ncbi:protein Niban 2-like [Hemiscyllium ocellatum]|uniref:protein Niban 2-like n=1 Tax=Hemiscyllium ocellatum TaxID=170820 RepID=UPI002966C97E|nr:protein Niban 2-like [Hemiscyllium ocellatum]